MMPKHHPRHSEDLLNSLPRILTEIRRIKADIAAKENQIEELKLDLEDHRYYGNIKDNKYSFEGVTVTRKKNPSKYKFTDKVSELKEKLKLRKELEIEDDIATELPRTYSWEVRVSKK